MNYFIFIIFLIPSVIIAIDIYFLIGQKLKPNKKILISGIILIALLYYFLYAPCANMTHFPGFEKIVLILLLVPALTIATIVYYIGKKLKPGKTKFITFLSIGCSIITILLLWIIFFVIF